MQLEKFVFSKELLSLLSNKKFRVTIILFTLFTELAKFIGAIQKSKFDEHIKRIVETLKLGLLIRKIDQIFEHTDHPSLNKYVRKRSLRSRKILHL